MRNYRVTVRISERVWSRLDRVSRRFEVLDAHVGLYCLEAMLPVAEGDAMREAMEQDEEDDPLDRKLTIRFPHRTRARLQEVCWRNGWREASFVRSCLESMLPVVDDAGLSEVMRMRERDWLGIG